MAELAAAIAVLASTGGMIAAGVTFGTRYIERELRLDRREVAVTREDHPAGADWSEVGPGTT